MSEKTYDFSDFDEPAEASTQESSGYDFSDFEESVPSQATPDSALENALETAGGTVGGGSAGQAARMGAEHLLPKAADSMSGLAEDLAYRGIGGRTTAEGKRFYTQAIGKVLPDPDMVNVTPRSVGRQILDENILGTLGLSSPESQLAKQRDITASKMGDKTNFIQQFDRPDLISKQDLLKEYRKLAGIDKLNPALDIDRKLNKGYEADVGAKVTPQNTITSNFDGTESILENEASKSKLQARSNYDGTAKEAARQTLDKAQAEARRIASEDAVKNLGGDALLQEFRDLKQRSGNAQVAEKILVKNTIADSMPSGHPNKLSKFVGEMLLEKAPAVGAKVVDTASDLTRGVANLAKSGLGKALPIGGAILGGIAGANAAEEAGLEAPEVAGLAVAEGLNPVPFTDTVKGYVEGKKAFQETGSPVAAGVAGLRGYASPAVDAANKFGQQQSTDARARMEQNMNALKPKQDAVQSFKEFSSQTPEQIMEFAKNLSQSGGAESSFSIPLEKAANANERSKAAILYGLYQQPAFRQLIKK